jgi:hypothetical protein
MALVSGADRSALPERDQGAKKIRISRKINTRAVTAAATTTQ